MTTPTPKAVLFDMDGVLVDSYDAHLESWLVMAEEHGQSFTNEDFDLVFGRTSHEIIAELWENCEMTQEEMSKNGRAKRETLSRDPQKTVPRHARRKRTDRRAR